MRMLDHRIVVGFAMCSYGGHDLRAMPALASLCPPGFCLRTSSVLGERSTHGKDLAHGSIRQLHSGILATVLEPSPNRAVPSRHALKEKFNWRPVASTKRTCDKIASPFLFSCYEDQSSPLRTTRSKSIGLPYRILLAQCRISRKLI